jgi:hypothetical protein
MDSVADVVGVALRSGLFLAGLVIGCFLGAVYAIMRRAWKDYRTVKKSVPGFRKSAIGSVPKVIKWGAIAGAGIIFAIIGMTATGNVGTPTVPAGVPSTVPSTSGSPR